ncbi:pyrimidine reductase family protein [Nakamurella antarctica]|uniref:pyrimidine reductase family protein n=1 Tax=Nakamurella antarctica TaxID=1902245 RepID=UPI0013DDFE22|nr:pyrimidine reductase family protein [Nakamurella antarctica]
MDTLFPAPAANLTDDDLAAIYQFPPESPGTYVRANMVISLEGGAAIDGVSAGLGSDSDRRVFNIQRDLADVILVGAGTVRKEGYGPSPLPNDRAQRRQRWTGRAQAPYAVVTKSGLDPELSFFNASEVQPLVITTTAGAEAMSGLRAGAASIIIAGDEDVDLQVALKALRDKGFSRVHCEGGPSLLGLMVAAGMVDELCLTTAPLLIGNASSTTLLGDTELPAPAKWTLASLLMGSGQLFSRYVRSSS